MKDKNQEDFIWQGETDIYLEKGCWNQRFLWISSMHEVNKTILLDIFRDKQDIVTHFRDLIAYMGQGIQKWSK